jgi:hypothetical protein
MDLCGGAPAVGYYILRKDYLSVSEDGQATGWGVEHRIEGFHIAHERPASSDVWFLLHHW